MSVPSHNSKSGKCFLTQGLLPRFCESEQPATRTKPFSVIMAKPLQHRVCTPVSKTDVRLMSIWVDLVIPSVLAGVWPRIEDLAKPVRFCRVTLRLSDLLTGDFFNVYIKIGKISMLSEGRSGIDPIYSLNEGTLRLELPKQLYEAAGLPGKPTQDKGRKHVKTRFAIEYDLRAASMVHGRKGFDRLYWASKNALGQSLTWLFVDLKGDSHAPGSPLAKHNPEHLTSDPVVVHKSLIVPSMQAAQHEDSETFQEDALPLLEWLDLVVMDSPRVQPDDQIDPFLCRYSAPPSNYSVEQAITCVSWRGFLPSAWVRQLFTRCLNAAMKSPEHWLSLSAHSFSPNSEDDRLGWTILRPPLQIPAELNRDVESQTEMNTTEDATSALGKSTRKPERPFPAYLLYEKSSK